MSEKITTILGTSLGVIGTALQTNELLQTISLIITIIGAVISMIVLPLINWYNKAKQDNKITHDEIKEAVEIVQNGVEKIEEETNKHDTSRIKK